MSYNGYLKGNRIMRCPKCGTNVLPSNIARHCSSALCERRTACKDMIYKNYSAVRRQSLPIILDFNVVFEERKYSNGKHMPYVWVKGWMGKICTSLKSRALRWSLHQIEHNYEFKSALESLLLLSENEWVPARYCKEQWETRKGKHKLSKVEAGRKHVQAEKA